MTKHYVFEVDVMSSKSELQEKLSRVEETEHGGDLQLFSFRYRIRVYKEDWRYDAHPCKSTDNP